MGFEVALFFLAYILRVCAPAVSEDLIIVGYSDTVAFFSRLNLSVLRGWTSPKLALDTVSILADSLT